MSRLPRSQEHLKTAFIAEAAGAKVSDWQGGKIFPVDLDSYEGNTFQVVAANRKVHPQIIEMIKSQTG